LVLLVVGLIGAVTRVHVLLGQGQPFGWFAHEVVLQRVVDGFGVEGLALRW